MKTSSSIAAWIVLGLSIATFIVFVLTSDSTNAPSATTRFMTAMRAVRNLRFASKSAAVARPAHIHGVSHRGVDAPVQRPDCDAPSSENNGENVADKHNASVYKRDIAYRSAHGDSDPRYNAIGKVRQRSIVPRLEDTEWTTRPHNGIPTADRDISYRVLDASSMRGTRVAAQAIESGYVKAALGL